MQAARPTVDHSVANASKTDDFDAVIRSQYTCHPLRFLCMLNYSCHLPILHLHPQTVVAGADFFSSVISFF